MPATPTPAPLQTQARFPRAKIPHTRQQAYDRMHADMLYANRNHLIGTFLREDLPLEWHLLEMDLPVQEKKEKVTLYLDRSVARLFRGMGQGYQARINHLLRTWMQMKIAKEVELDEALGERRRLNRHDLERLMAEREAADREEKQQRQARAPE